VGRLLGGGTILSPDRARLEAWGCAAPNRTWDVIGSRGPLSVPLGLPPCAILPRVGGITRLGAAPRVLGRAPKQPPLWAVVLDPSPFPGLPAL
jgi:hypothetical protein